tara:strand:+ start:124 stop:300 length:177 start_codon:yes stop_codon:yes gene_type:complete
MQQTYKDILIEAKDEIKVIWRDAWDEYKFAQHQREVDTLAISLKHKINELKQNPYFHS